MACPEYQSPEKLETDGLTGVWEQAASGKSGEGMAGALRGAITEPINKPPDPRASNNKPDANDQLKDRYGH